MTRSSRTARTSPDLARELEAARAAQRATTEVLAAISRSPDDLPKVLDTIAQSSRQLVEAESIAILLVEDGLLHVRASTDEIPAREPFPLDPGFIGPRAVLEQRTIQVPDVLSADDFPLSRERAKQAGLRTLLVVPLRARNGAIGVINAPRREVRPFTAAQIRMLESFADQAVIAIENARLFDELRERLQEQTATADVLRVINQSPTDLQLVLDTIAAAAARLCDTPDATVYLLEGDQARTAAWFNENPTVRVDPSGQAQAAGVKTGHAFPLDPTRLTGRTLLARRLVHVEDIRALPEDQYRGAAAHAAAGTRTFVAVPLLREEALLGAIVLRRGEVRPFSAQQIALLEAFANQAVIAIENARLFQELQASNRELRDALEEQRTTGEILRVISRSPADLQGVLETIAEGACRVCGGELVFVNRVADAQYWIVTGYWLDPARAVPLEQLAGTRPQPIGPDHPVGRCILERRTVAGNLAEAETALSRENARHYGYRSYICTPILREGEAIGAFGIARYRVDPFSDKQIALLETFADQAAIAIENARLFQELQDRLEEQTATAEVLRVISQSPTDLQRVLDTIAASAARICDAPPGIIGLVEGDRFRAVAGHTIEGQRKTLQSSDDYVWRAGTTVIGVAIRERRAVHIEDLAAVPPEELESRGAREAGVRTQLVVPMLRQEDVIGVIGVARREVRSFTSRQIELLQTFADQAVIAVENARLFRELQESNQTLRAALEQQTATADVLKALSRSPTELQRVLDTIAASAVRLCRADDAQMFGLEGETLRLVAHHGPISTPGGADGWSIATLGRGSVNGRALLDRTTVHVPDIEAVPEDQLPIAWDMHRRFGSRTLLCVPLLREGQPIGTILLRRTTARAFAAAEVALLETFSDQAVIAMENARLFAELQEKNRQLEEASRHKSDFLASMSHELRTPLNAIIGFAEVLLDPAMAPDEVLQKEFLGDILSSGRHLLTLINDILDISKVEAGRMELRPEEFVVAEALEGVHAIVRPLVAKKRQTLTLEIDSALQTVIHDPGRFKQVLYNLLSNANKFTPEGGRIATTARRDGEWLEIAVRDSGIGIAPEDQETIFEEFRQIDSGHARKQQGTGLGLALVRNFVRLMGGDVTIQSTLGQGSTFALRLPLRYGERASAQDAGGALVLVVEDDDAAASLLGYQLRRAGYRVERAGSAESGLARARDLRPAAITLDLQLPEAEDGWRLLRELKGDPATAEIPVAIVSVLDDQGRARRAGAAVHLVKPVDPTTLLDTLHGLIAGGAAKPGRLPRRSGHTRRRASARAEG